MPPKNAGDASDDGTNEGKLPQNQSGRVLRSQNPRENVTQGFPPVPSNNLPARDRGKKSGDNNGEFPRPRDSVYRSVEAKRRQLITTLRNAERAAQIPEFEKHLLNQAREKDPDESNRNVLVAEANRAVGGSEKFKPGVRWNAHVLRREAASLCEDFLYYQTPEYRNQYREHIDENKGEKKMSMRKGQPPGLLTQNHNYDKQLRPIVNSFENNGVGTTEEVDYKNMGPDDLHVRPPRARRVAVGLGRPRSPPILSPINLHLDSGAIERRRMEIEDENKDYPRMNESHSERRIRESELLSPLPTAKNLSRTRLESGLFIAAGEASFDWEDSYDQLDAVAPGRILDLPAKPISGLTRDELNEFCKSPTTPIQYDAGIGHDHIEVTSWAEATDGLRERDEDDDIHEMPDEDDDSSDEDSSDDENDLLKISYRQCSGLGACQYGGDGDSDSSDDDDSSDDGNGGNGNKEGNADPVVPVSVAGGPLIGSKKTKPDAKNNTSRKHDYKQYNRIQLRQGCKYLGKTQNAKNITELYERVEKWDNEHPGDAFHNYIIKQKDVARSFDASNGGKTDKQWKDAYGGKVDEQNKQNKEQEEESDEEQEANLEDAGEGDMEVEQARERADSDEVVMGGVIEGESAISTEERTINPTTSASPPSSETSRTPKSRKKAPGAAKTKSTRRSERKKKT